MVKHHNYNRNPKHLAALALSLLLLVSIVLVQGSLLLVFAQTSDTDDKHFVSDPSYSTDNKDAGEMMDDIDEMKKRLEEINREIDPHRRQSPSDHG